MKFKTVFFDFDSTLVTIEGINELARLKGQYETVSQLTAQAMDGQVSFAKVFSRRLELIRPTLTDLQALALTYAQHLTPGAYELLSALRLQGVTCHLISGGYTQAIMPTALQLGFARENVHAIELMPDSLGWYTQTKTNSVLINHDGKKQLIPKLKPERLSVLIGDGHTDAQTITVVDRFIGYAGVTQSSRLQTLTPYHSYAPNLLSLLKFIN